MSQCAERTGFLFKHRCDRMGQRDCQQCGKKICDRHTVTTSLAEDSSKSLLESNSILVCTSCAKKIGKRLSNYGAYEDPYWYGYGHYHGWGHHHSYHSSTHQSSASSTPPPLPGDAPDETLAYDPNDLTEADGAATEIPGDEGFETDMEGS